MKPGIYRTAVTAAMSTAALSVAAGPMAANPLREEQWKTRPLVIVAPSADDPIVSDVRNALATTATRDAFAKRDMVLYTVIGGEARRNDAPLPPAQAMALLTAVSATAFGPAQAVLVGKDGSVKLRQRERVDFGQIIPTIDAMPMMQNR